MLENEISLQENTKQQIASTISWTKMSAIISIIGIGIGALQIIILLAKGENSILTSLISFLISSVISIIMSINLLNYSKHIKSSLQTQDSTEFNMALYHLKNYFTIMGVLFIIAISLLLLGIIISLLSLVIN